MNIALAITALRFVLAPIACGLYYQGVFKWALILATVSAFTDLIDGEIARRTGRTTELGARLDPLADKWFALLAFCVLSLRGYIDWSLTLLVIGRDVVIILGIGLLTRKGIKLRYRPATLSKWTTMVQMITLVSTFVLSYCAEAVDRSTFLCDTPAVAVLQSISVLFAAWFTVLSGLNYLWIGYRLCKRSPN